MKTQSSRYEIVRLSGGWAVVMQANQHIMEIFPSEAQAAAALVDFNSGRGLVKDKREVWVIADAFVSEAGLGGMQLGEIDELDMRQYQVVRRLTQDEFDALQEEFKAEHGHYPDT